VVVPRVREDCGEVDHKRTYSHCEVRICVLTVTNMAKVRNFEVMSGRVKIFAVGAFGNCVQAWMTKLLVPPTPPFYLWV
jgi:hypothetical protein